MTVPRTVYTFWEPPDAMPAYIRLCLRTWEAHLDGWRVEMLDYENLARHLGEGALDLEALRHFRLAVQKDAIEAAVLCRNGGVFMDADTILTGPLDSIVAHLAKTELVLFDVYLGFAAARANGVILTRWLDEVRARLARPGEAPAGPEGWSYLGNDILAATMDAMIDDAPAMRVLARTPPGLAIRSWRDRKMPDRKTIGALRRLARRIKQIFFRKARRAIFLASHGARLTMLDGLRRGFVPERRRFRTGSMQAREKYERFWFGDSVGLEAVFTQGQPVIALHNSWTPDWYARLSEADVLAHHCLLSRTLRHLLGSPASPPPVDASDAGQRRPEARAPFTDSTQRGNPDRG